MKRIPVLALLLPLALALPLTGCALQETGSPGPDIDTDPDPDPGTDPDPDPGTDPDPDPSACTVLSSYDLGPLGAGTAAVVPQDANQPDGPKWLTFGVQLTNPDDPAAIPDAILIQLWEGYGPFTAGFAPGTYTIAGADTDLYNCGACVLMLGDVDQASGIGKQVFMAQGGTFTIDAVDPTPGTGTLTGSLSNVSLAEVIADDANQTQTLVSGGCATTIGSLSFDLDVVAMQ